MEEDEPLSVPVAVGGITVAVEVAERSDAEAVGVAVSPALAVEVRLAVAWDAEADASGVPVADALSECDDVELRVAVGTWTTGVLVAVALGVP